MWRKLQKILANLFFPYLSAGVAEELIRLNKESTRLLDEMDALNADLRSKLTILDYELRVIKKE